jgi:hypothetical protein
VVYAGYYPGYLGWHVYGPTVVYGTGWYYPGWYGPDYYYPYPWTWGFGIHYNPSRVGALGSVRLCGRWSLDRFWRRQRLGWGALVGPHGIIRPLAFV